MLAGAIGQGVLWLWDKTDHRFRTAFIHCLLVFSIIVVAEKLAVGPLAALQVKAAPELQMALQRYTEGLRLAAGLILLVPFGKWGYELFSVYVNGLRKQQEAGFPLSSGQRLLITFEVVIVLLVAAGIALMWLVGS